MKKFWKVSKSGFIKSWDCPGHPWTSLYHFSVLGALSHGVTGDERSTFAADTTAVPIFAYSVALNSKLHQFPPVSLDWWKLEPFLTSERWGRVLLNTNSEFQRSTKQVNTEWFRGGEESHGKQSSNGAITEKQVSLISRWRPKSLRKNDFVLGKASVDPATNHISGMVLKASCQGAF